MIAYDIISEVERMGHRIYLSDSGKLMVDWASKEPDGYFRPMIQQHKEAIMAVLRAEQRRHKSDGERFDAILAHLEAGEFTDASIVCWQMDETSTALGMVRICLEYAKAAGNQDMVGVFRRSIATLEDWSMSPLACARYHTKLGNWRRATRAVLHIEDEEKRNQALTYLRKQAPEIVAAVENEYRAGSESAAELAQILRGSDTQRTSPKPQPVAAVSPKPQQLVAAPAATDMFEGDTSIRQSAAYAAIYGA